MLRHMLVWLLTMTLPAAGGALADDLPAAAPPAASTEAFDIPVWHPDARWQEELFAGCSSGGHLDGPRLEMEYFSVGVPTPSYQPQGAGKYVIGFYDAATERGHMVAGSAQGYLDGPFTRARIGGWDYNVRPHSAASPDGRYRYFTDGYNNHVLRVMDFQEQEVRTVLPDAKNLLGIVTDPQGRLYVLKQGGEIAIVTADGKVEKTLKVQMKETIKGWGASLAFDEVHGRIYATAYGMAGFYIWYWDLKDGSFNGVLPIAKEGQPRRAKSEPGPFEGTSVYNQGSVMFGPDDPQKRFLYTARVDTWNFFRLDLEKKEIWAMATEGAKGQPRIARFIGEGKAGHLNIYGGAAWRPDYSIISGVHSPFNIWRYRRIK